MSLTDDARLVVDSELGPHKFNHIATVSADSWKAAVRLATAYIEASRVDGGGCPRCGSIRRGEFFGCETGAPGPQRQTGTCKDRQIANLTARLATVSADLAEHKRRLMEQSAVLNSVRQERDVIKQRIAAAPVAWVQFGNHNNPCEISEDRETFWDGEHPPGTLRQVRLLEVGDWENPGAEVAAAVR